MWIVYLNLFWAYLKIGLFGFGGGYAMLSLIQHEAVEVVHYGESQPWLTPTEFTDIVAISQMTPGPIGINSATYVGYVAAGNLGVDNRHVRRMFAVFHFSLISEPFYT